jgi:hydrogenase nickel incorporation protein HypA/HybF
MHEMSLAESVLEIAEQAAREQGFRRVKAIRLEIGALSAVDPEAMRFCFSAVARNSMAEAARLEVVAVAGSAQCLQCAKQVEVETLGDLCPECGSHRLEITGGMEMRVKEMEVE